MSAWAAIAGGVASAAASQFDFFGNSSVEDSRRFNAKEAQKNRDFQERMAGSAYQRGMTDMKKAGLNPILAYGGKGAATPGGSQASSSAVTPPYADTLGKAAMSAVGLVRMKMEKKRLDQELKNMKATEHATLMQAHSSNNDAILKYNQAIATAAQTNATNQNTYIQGFGIPAAKAAGHLDQTKHGEFLRKWNRFMGGLTGSLPIRPR